MALASEALKDLGVDVPHRCIAVHLEHVLAQPTAVEPALNQNHRCHDHHARPEETSGQTDRFALTRVKARQARDSREVIISWANLAYLALRQKFRWNLEEKLADFTIAKASGK